MLLGTGNKGSVIELEGNGVYSTVAQPASSQVTSLLTGPGGKVFVATANPGKVFTLGPGYAKEGTFESDTFDANIFSHWGRLTWWGENGATDRKNRFLCPLGQYLESGEELEPVDGAVQESNDSAAVNCPPARFAQWKAEFLDTDHGQPRVFRGSAWRISPKTLRPMIDDMAIQDPGVRIQEFPQQIIERQNATPVQLRMPQRSGGAVSPSPANAEEFPKAPHVEVPPQGLGIKAGKA